MVIPAASRTDAIDALISSGTSISAGINLGNMVLAGVLIPAAWTAANVTFQGSLDGVTYANVHTIDGTEYALTAAASRFIQLPPSSWSGIRYVKVRSGTSGVPVNQAGDRTLVLVGRNID